MSLKKDTYVKHPKDEIHAAWGNGIVLEDEKNKRVPIFFEHNSQRKIIDTNYVQLQKIGEPKESVLFLQNALYEDVGDRQPFPMVLEKFLFNFDGGLQGALYLNKERNYKVEASKFSQDALDKDKFKRLIDEEDWTALSSNIKRAFSKSNLLASFEMIKLGAALKKDEDIKDISNAFFELLHGDSDVYQRVESAANKLEEFELNKWPVVTYLLFMMYPSDYMFVKPTMTKQAAENRGFDIQYESKVNANTYRKIMLFSQDLFERLNSDKRQELHPVDMIDVQGFMWCTFSQGWSVEEIKRAQEQLNKKDH